MSLVWPLASCESSVAFVASRSDWLRVSLVRVAADFVESKTLHACAEVVVFVASYLRGISVEGEC